MALPQTTYVHLDSANDPIEPPQQPVYSVPFFGGHRLRKVDIRTEGGQLEEVDERNELAKILFQASNHFSKQTKAFAVGAGVEMFNISARQWEDVEGFLRQQIWQANSTTMPLFLSDGEKLYDAGPQLPKVKSAIRFDLLLDLEERFPFIVFKNLPRKSFAREWYSSFWDYVYTTQSKLLSDHQYDISKNVFGRADQFFMYAWSHSDVGVRSMKRTRNSNGEVTGFVLENVKTRLSFPPSWPRPPLAQLDIRIIVDVQQSQLRNTRRTDAGVEVPVTRGQLYKSVTISYATLKSMEIDGRVMDLFGKLRYAIEADLEVDFASDGLFLAWRNPRDFWGNRDRLCRVRDIKELVAVLGLLREIHLVNKGDKTIFLYLVSKVHEELLSEEEHPVWPEGFDVELKPDLRVVRVKTAPSSESEGTPTPTARKRKKLY